jgi:hypothetical protein
MGFHRAEPTSRGEKTASNGFSLQRNHTGLEFHLKFIYYQPLQKMRSLNRAVKKTNDQSLTEITQPATAL